MVRASSADELPRLKSTLRLGGRGTNTSRPFYDVKFYPFTTPGLDPVFAVVGAQDAIVCRPRKELDQGLDILQWVQDGDPEAGLNSLTWIFDPEAGKPYLCVTGSDPKIKILDVASGALARTVIGHGAEINDMQTSPADSQVIATASADNTVRIWHLGSQNAKQPCGAICAGDGHRAGVLTVAFHPTGRWLLSGGFDTRICLWALPSPDSLERTAGTDHPTQIHFPHFATTELHADYVDCTAFHGDLVLSKCARESRILLWKITDFNPNIPPEQQPPAAPHTKRGLEFQSDTRSAFVNNGFDEDTGPKQAFQLLMTFDLPKSEMFFMRFAFFPGLAPTEQPASHPAATTTERQPPRIQDIATHPVLACGNEASRVFFWDLQALEEGRQGTSGGLGGRREGAGRKPKTQPGIKKATPLPTSLRPDASTREASVASEVTRGSVVPTSRDESVARSTTQDPPTADTSAPMRKTIGGPFHGQRAHSATSETHVTFTARTTAFSVGGEWCVTVGDAGMMMIFRRWDNVEVPVEEAASTAKNGTSAGEGDVEDRPGDSTTKEDKPESSKLAAGPSRATKGRRPTGAK